jgi:hypothetical protein
VRDILSRESNRRSLSVAFRGADQPKVTPIHLQCRSASLLGRGPIGGQVCGSSNPRKLFDVTIPSPKVFHPLLDRIRKTRVTDVVRHFSAPPVPGLILLFADELALIFLNTLSIRNTRSAVALVNGSLLKVRLGVFFGMDRESLSSSICS